MQLALGILLLVSFLVFIVYAAKGGNLMMGLFAMAVLWCAIGPSAALSPGKISTPLYSIRARWTLALRP